MNRQTYHAKMAAIRSSVQPAQPLLAYSGAAIAAVAFILSVVRGDAPGMDVFRDAAVQAAVLAALAFIPGRWWDRTVVIVCVAVLVVLDVAQLYAVWDWSWIGLKKCPDIAHKIEEHKPILGTIASGVLIAQTLSPLWMRGLGWFVREMWEVIRVAWITARTPPERRSQIRPSDLGWTTLSGDWS